MAPHTISHGKRPIGRRDARRAAAGFTVIELLVTVTIAAILVAVAGPSFKNLIVSTRIKNATSDIYASLALARSEAIKRNANVTVGPLTAGGLWTNGWQVVAGGVAINTHGAVTNVTIQCPTGTDCTQTLTYARNGKLTSGTVNLNVDMQSPPSQRQVPMRCVNVDLSGRVNVQIDNNLDGNCTNG